MSPAWVIGREWYLKNGGACNRLMFSVACRQISLWSTQIKFFPVAGLWTRADLHAIIFHLIYKWIVIVDLASFPPQHEQSTVWLENLLRNSCCFFVFWNFLHVCYKKVAGPFMLPSLKGQLWFRTKWKWRQQTGFLFPPSLLYLFIFWKCRFGEGTCYAYWWGRTWIKVGRSMKFFPREERKIGCVVWWGSPGWYQGRLVLGIGMGIQPQPIILCWKLTQSNSTTVMCVVMQQECAFFRCRSAWTWRTWGIRGLLEGALWWLR